MNNIYIIKKKHYAYQKIIFKSHQLNVKKDVGEKHTHLNIFCTYLPCYILKLISYLQSSIKAIIKID